MPASAFGTTASGMTGSSGGFPPTNDIINAGINAGGLAAPLGFGEIAGILKGIFQQTFGGTQSNTNPMSVVDAAAYGPNIGEKFVDWVSSQFSGGANPTPTDAQFQTSSAQTGTNGPNDFLSRSVSSLEQAVAGIFGNQSPAAPIANSTVAGNPNGSGVAPAPVNAGVPGQAGNPFGPRPYYGTSGPSSTAQSGPVISGGSASSEAGKAGVANAGSLIGGSLNAGNAFGPTGDFGSLGFSVDGGTYGGGGGGGSGLRAITQLSKT